MSDLIYRKYEECSPYYILNIEYLSHLYQTLNQGQPINQLEAEFHQRIEEDCYYNLRTDQIEDFSQKLVHNIRLAQAKNDHQYLNYLQFKFQIQDNLIEIDPKIWSYQPKKIKLKLKPNAIKVSYYTVNEKLADILSLETDQKFKWKSEILKLVHQYIYENRLQNIEIKSQINPDPKMKSVIQLPKGETFITYYNLEDCLVSEISAHHPEPDSKNN